MKRDWSISWIYNSAGSVSLYFNKLAVSNIVVRVVFSSIWHKFFYQGLKMKYLVTVLVTLVICAAAAFFLFQDFKGKMEIKRDLENLSLAEQAVKKNLSEITRSITSRLNSFTKAVSEDRNFSLRLLVENDRSSPDVTQTSVKFIGPMGFSVLELTDSAFTILSSGHFPANAGNSISAKANRLAEEPGIYLENMMGEEVLTLQAIKRFEIADIPFFAVGGLKIDQNFLDMLSPGIGIGVLLRDESRYMGEITIRSISEIKNNRILINDQEYLATQFPLTPSGENTPALIVVLMNQDRKPE